VLAADVDPDLVLDTLATMDEQTTEGAAWLTAQAVDTGAAAPLDQLTEWSDEQSAGLAALRAALPGAAQDELDDSRVLLADIGTRSVALDEVLGCASGPPIEATDDLGPVPGLCLDEQSTPPVAGGEGGDPTTVPVPGSGSESGVATTTANPSVTPGGGTDAGGPATGGAGEGSELPTGEAPGGGLPSVSVPSVPLPSVSVPGLSGSGSSSSSSSSSPPPVDVNICIGPIVVGDCSD
jgi:hypothetical protein